MRTVIFPTLEEALYLHQQLVNSFGGEDGVSDRGLLESALARPRSGYYDSLSEKAAALMQSLLINHCFVDGNKRMGFALAAVFLKMNGYSVEVGAEEAEEFIVNDILGKHSGIDVISSWLEEFIEPANAV